jgi:hypothetical protein
LKSSRPKFAEVIPSNTFCPLKVVVWRMWSIPSTIESVSTCSPACSSSERAPVFAAFTTSVPRSMSRSLMTE